MKTIFIIWCVIVFIFVQYVAGFVSWLTQIPESTTRTAACIFYIVFLLYSAVGYYIGNAIQRWLDK